MANKTNPRSDNQQKSGSKTSRLMDELGFQLLFPAIVIVFTILYVQNTYHRLEFSNLVYPYTVIGVLLFSTIGVSLREVYTHLSNQNEEKARQLSIIEMMGYNQKPIFVAGSAILYPLLIEVIGFFPASAVTLVGLMLALGVKSWKQITITTLLLLVGIYLMFVEVLGLQVPQGVFGL